MAAPTGVLDGSSGQPAHVSFTQARRVGDPLVAPAAGVAIMKRVSLFCAILLCPKLAVSASYFVHTLANSQGISVSPIF